MNLESARIDAAGRSRRPHRTVRAAVLLLLLGALPPAIPAAEAQSAQALYTRALARERQVRDASERASASSMRAAIRAYEGVVRRFPRSGYCDNALWQAANLAVLAYERFNQADDRRTATRLFTLLKNEYPHSDLARRVDAELASLNRLRSEIVAAARASEAPAPPPEPAAAPAVTSPVTAVSHAAPAADAEAAGGLVTIRDVTRTEIPDGIRVTIEMDGESLYHSELIENPQRLFFDFRRTRTTLSLQDATIRFPGELVREIRFGRHPQNTTRVVIDLEAIDGYSVFTLYNPFRLVVDLRRPGAGKPASPAALPRPSSASPVRRASVEPAASPAVDAVVPAARAPVPLAVREAPPDLTPPPAAPSANGNGQFSIARQLGLGISRIVLDPGHGGHDPGARANGLSEAELVLDVTLRLKALLEKEPGIEVTLTRDKDVFIPLEERTAIANRTGADLFLSIHANASRNVRARGIETYFLNFASNPEAEAVAARENSASARTMHSLPEIVKAIALNNKIDESRDFADMVQKAMVKGLSAKNKEVRDLGVKQAPFVVLIGAGMPSVLAEISFVTNRPESALLKTPAYRQQIAESLLEAIVRYQRSLKSGRAVARR